MRLKNKAGTPSEIRDALAAMYAEAEEMAMSGYAYWDGRFWIFNDRAWKDEDTDVGFAVAMRARRVLGLGPLSVKSTESPIRWNYKKLRAKT